MILSDKENPEIELIDFSLRKDDITLKSTYLGWLNDLEVIRPIASPELLQSKGPEFIEKSYKRFTTSDCKGFFINYVPDEIVVGTAKLDCISQYTRSATDGIMIGEKAYHGKGIAFLVYRLLLAYAFRELELNRVSGGCNEFNIPMIKTFIKLGYSHEGRFRRADLIDGVYSDHLYFGILKEEFFNKHKIKMEILRRDL